MIIHILSIMVALQECLQVTLQPHLMSAIIMDTWEDKITLFMTTLALVLLLL